MKSIVYVVCEPTHKVDGVEKRSMNILPAREFGDLQILLPTSQSLFATVPTVRMLREKLRNFSDDDYILPVGDPVLIATVAMIAAEVNGGRVKMLKWDKQMRTYFSLQIDTSGRAV